MGLQREPEAMLRDIRWLLGQADAATGDAAPAPVQSQGTCAVAVIQIDPRNGVVDQGGQRGPVWRCGHAQQRRALMPALQVGREQMGFAVEDQHGFKQPIRQLQAAIGERQMEVVAVSPLAVMPRQCCRVM